MVTKKNKNQLAFTLIELLVVTSILGLLASIILVSVKTTRTKARDGRRTADLHQIRTALLLYYANHGKFPCNDGTGSYYDDQFLKPLVDDKLIAKIPKDPINSPAYEYDYYTFHTPGGSCGQYALLADYKELPNGVCADGGAWSNSDQHCHILIPEPLPAPCLNPYYLDQNLGLPGNQSCVSWADTVNDW